MLLHFEGILNYVISKDIFNFFFFNVNLFLENQRKMDAKVLIFIFFSSEHRNLSFFHFPFMTDYEVLSFFLLFFWLTGSCLSLKDKNMRYCTFFPLPSVDFFVLFCLYASLKTFQAYVFSCIEYRGTVVFLCTY